MHMNYHLFQITINLHRLTASNINTPAAAPPWTSDLSAVTVTTHLTTAVTVSIAVTR